MQEFLQSRAALVGWLCATMFLSAFAVAFGGDDDEW